MSLINQVLRELETKNSHNDTLAKPEAVEEAKPQQKFLHIIMGSVLGAVFCIFIIYFFITKFVHSSYNTRTEVKPISTNVSIQTGIKQPIHSVVKPLVQPLAELNKNKFTSNKQNTVHRSKVNKADIIRLNSEFVQYVNSLKVFPAKKGIDSIEKSNLIDLPPINSAAAGGNYNSADESINLTQAKNTPIKIASHKNPRVEYADAVQYFSEGFYMRGEKSLLDILEQNPQAHKSLKLLTKYYYSSNQLVQAKSILAKYLPYQTNNQECMRFNVKILYELNDHERALAWLKKVDLNYQDTELLSIRAYLYQEQGDFEQSLVNYEMLVAIQPENSIWWVGKGIAEANLNKDKKAFDSFNHAKQFGHLSKEVANFVDNKIHELIQG